LYNDGGPLAAGHAKLFVKETGGAHISSSTVSVPAMAHGASKVLTLKAGTAPAYRGKVPGQHRLTVSLSLGGKTTTSMLMARLPSGLCQPQHRRMQASPGIHLRTKTDDIRKLNPQPEPPSAPSRLSLPGR
jgi:hypothetical protein